MTKPPSDAKDGSAEQDDADEDGEKDPEGRQ